VTPGGGQSDEDIGEVPLVEKPKEDAVLRLMGMIKFDKLGEK
jgi:hypothetical protein